MASVLPDPTTKFGARVVERLQTEQVIWLTTTSADGTPQPNPIWFVWDGEAETVLVYSKEGAARLINIRRNSHVSLSFNTDEGGNDVVVLTGEAQEAPEEVPANLKADYVAKYSADINNLFKTPENYARMYPDAIRITVHKVRGF